MSVSNICPFGPKLQKYWDERYWLMKKFDLARIDAGTLYTLTPEKHALDIAQRTPGETVLEICSGAGGSAIGFARAGKKVTGVEIDPARVEMAKHNAKVYEVEIDFVCADAMEYVQRPEVKGKQWDVLFLEPPWGSGPGKYHELDKIRLENLALGNVDLRDISNAVNCEHVGIRLPYKFDYESLGLFDHRVIRQDYNGQDGNWHYSLIVMPKEQFVNIPRFQNFAPGMECKI